MTNSIFYIRNAKQAVAKRCCFMLLYWLVAMSLQAVGADRPNIVVYLSDDHSQFDSSEYGNRNIPTPEIARLAADGIKLTRTFVASPSCAPSRSAMLTGLMPARNGAEANHTTVRAGTHSLIRVLQNAGYEVAAFGKVAHGRSTAYFGFNHSDAGATLEQLEQNVTKYLETRNADKPLCLFVGTSNPHVSWTAQTTFDPAAVEFPPHHVDTPSTREHRAAYYQEIKELDTFLGTLRKISGKHLGENVLMIYTSDHGSQWPFGKWNLYDYGIRIPLIAAWPGKIAPGSVSDAMVSWIDLLPTLIDIGKGTVPDNLDGRSFAKILLGEKTSHRDLIFTTQTGDGDKNIYPIRSVRTQEWKLIHNLHPEFAHTNHSDLDRKPMAGAYWTEWAQRAKTDERAKSILDRYFRRPEWELYKVSEDKWEQSNVIDDPANAQIVATLKKQLADWIRESGDQQFVHAQPRLLAEPERWHPDFFKPEQQQP